MHRECFAWFLVSGALILCRPGYGRGGLNWVTLCFIVSSLCCAGLDTARRVLRLKYPPTQLSCSMSRCCLSQNDHNRPSFIIAVREGLALVDTPPRSSKGHVSCSRRSGKHTRARTDTCAHTDTHCAYGRRVEGHYRASSLCVVVVQSQAEIRIIALAAHVPARV